MTAHMHRWKFSALAAAAFVTAALTTTNAAALALGSLNVHSALGEPLRADIHIPQATPAELDSLRANIASAELFRAQGMDLSQAASTIQVSVLRRPDGTAELQLRSAAPIQEPFLDLVIDTRWSTGNSVRSYTLLLDPPRTQPAPLPTPMPAQVTSANPAPRVVSTEPAVVPAPAPAVRPAAVPTAPARTVSTEPAASTQTAAADSVTVRRGDTAGRLAEAHLPAGVSLDQMLVAMLRSNPKAFSNGNVNQLRAGAIVKMPDRETALRTSAAEARQIVAAQSRDFNAFRRGLAAKAPEAAVQAADRASGGQVKAHVQDARPAAQAPDKLTLSKGAVQSAAAAAAEEKLAAQKQAKEQADRLSELQRNLAELNQLSQQQTAAQPVEPPVPSTAEAAATAAPSTPAAAPAAPSTPSNTATPDAPALPAAPASAPALTAAADTASVEAAPIDASSSPVDPTASATSSSSEQPAADTPSADAADVAADVTPAPTATPATEAPRAATSGWLDRLRDNPLMPAGGGILALLLAWAGYRAWQRKQAQARDEAATEAAFDPSLDAAPTPWASTDVPPDTVSLDSATAATALSPTDAVAQADDLLAYGRDIQAEAVLLQALSLQPQQLAVHAKLAEIHAKRQDLPAFEATARELHDYSLGEGPEWERVAALGQQLAPGNPLYASAIGAAEANTAAAAPLSTSAFAQALNQAYGDAPMDTDSDATAATSPAADDMPPLSGLDVNLGLDLPEGLAATTAPAFSASPVAVALPSDDDFAALEQPDAASRTEGEAAWNNSTSRTPDLADAPASSESVAATPTNDDASAADHGIELDFTLDPLAEATAPAAAPAAPSADNGLAFDIDSLDLDLGPTTGPAFGGDAVHNAVDDPLSTKLDLAQEFNTIGDSEGARSLIEEVLAEASGPLKERAQQMLSKLD